MRGTPHVLHAVCLGDDRQLAVAKASGLEVVDIKRGMGIFIALFPSGVHGVAYQCGLALGLWFHLLVRWREQNSVTHDRERAFVLQRLETAPTLTVDEREALTLFVRGKFKALDRVLHTKQSLAASSSGLVFVRALYEWQKGEFLIAKLLVEAEIARLDLIRFSGQVG
jgi:hypothetical protein